MNHTANIDHHAVLRARVALLGSGVLPAKERVAACRVLAQVSPLAYLPILATVLEEYSRQFAHQPETALALLAESVTAARGMCALEPERGELLVFSLTHYRERLDLMNRQEEVGAVDEEIARLRADPGRSPRR